MMSHTTFLSMLWILLLCPDSGLGLLKPQNQMDEIYDKIYTKLAGNPCVRLLHNDGQVGCAGPRDGVTAPLVRLISSAEMEAFVNHPPRTPRVVLTSPNFLNPQQLAALSGTGKLAGVLVDALEVPATGYSSDDVDPNSRFGLHPDSVFPWNDHGNGVASHDYAFPIWGLSPKATRHAHHAAERNKQVPNGKQFVVQMKGSMFASADSATCLAAGSCLPLGGRNIVGSFGELPPTRPVVLALAALDSSALFHDLSYGAASDLSSLLATLAAASALAQAGPLLDTFPQQIVVALVGAEAWGYTGSRALMRSMRRGVPFFLRNISAAVELRQVAHYGEDATGSFFVHREGNDDTAQAVVDAIAQAANASQQRGEAALKVKVSPAAASAAAQGLPPSSMHSLLRELPRLPAALITDHPASYTNKYFRSHVDGPDNLDTNAVCRAASLLANTLLLLASGQRSLDEQFVTASCSQIEDLARCFLSDFTCPLVTSLLPGVVSPPEPLSLYTSVFSGRQPPVPAALAYYWLANATALPTTPVVPCSSLQDCQHDNQSECVLGKCVRHRTSAFDAISPGIEWESSTQRWTVTDNSQPVWTESYWGNDIGLLLYVETDRAAEVAVAVAGGVLTLLWCVVGSVGWHVYARHVKQN